MAVASNAALTFQGALGTGHRWACRGPAAWSAGAESRTCGRPGLDVPCAVDHGVLRFSLFHGAEAVPAGRRCVRLLLAPGWAAGTAGAPRASKPLGLLVCRVVLNLVSPPPTQPASPESVPPRSLSQLSPDTLTRGCPGPLHGQPSLPG